MTSIVDEDDAVVAAAWDILEGDAPEGTENVRRGETEDGAEYVYRIDPDVAGEGDVEAEVDADAVGPDGEFPDADVVAWRANRDEVEREVGRRDVEETGRATAGETGGNREGQASERS